MMKAFEREQATTTVLEALVAFKDILEAKLFQR